MISSTASARRHGRGRDAVLTGPGLGEDLFLAHVLGKQRLADTYRWLNDLPLRDGDDALLVGWCELITTDAEGNVIYSDTPPAEQLVDVHRFELPAEFAGHEYDTIFLEQIPDHIDPCGENGEFHSFAYDGPMFESAVNVSVGETVSRDGFVFTDLLPG